MTRLEKLRKKPIGQIKISVVWSLYNIAYWYYRRFSRAERLVDALDDLLWDLQFSVWPEALERMAANAIKAYEAGLTDELDLDKL